MAKFEPYYDRVLGSHITSQHDQDRKMKAHRSPSHPQGLYNVRDDKKFLNEMANLQRHRENYKASTMPGYEPRTQRELERQGERRYDAARPDADSTGNRKYFHR